MQLSFFTKVTRKIFPLKDSLKSVLFRIFADFVRLNLVIGLIILIVRFGQYKVLSALHTLPPDALWLEFRGLLLDLVLWQYVSWVIFFPFFLLSFLRRWLGLLFFSSFSLFIILTDWALFQYFSVTLRPLDQVVFSYSINEMMLIAGNCVKIDFLTFLPFIVLFLLTAAFFLLSFKLRLSKHILILFLLLSLAALLVKKAVTPDENKSRNTFEYYLVINKSACFFEKCIDYLAGSKQSNPVSMLEAASKRYQAVHPEFKFLGTNYPFLHYDNTPDVLGNFFTLGKEKPNLVFIIVESLSSCFMGNNPIFGSFTPFLDSLAGQSLFWNNFLSTADRTFNVLPAMFASLPPGDPTFINEVSKIPYHLSMIRYLHDNGYYTSFFYGGDPYFNYMKDFLQRQETDYILQTFGSKYTKTILNEGYSWGYSDTDLFERSFEVMDSLKKSPRLDIFLTLSLHSPFIPPDQAYYLSLIDQRVKEIGNGSRKWEDLEKYKNIFATILYTDHALKVFLDNYRNKPGYKNTIFVITGDHGLPELNLFRFSGLEHYHVPLIIYSPLLKRPAFFRSVSSHLDVTPSFLALLQKHYGLKVLSVAPWLGSGIDTAAAPINIHTIPFILNSKEILEYVNHAYYLYQGGVQKIQPELWLKDTIDPATRQKLTRELADFKILNTYVTKQNKLIPPEMFFWKMIDSAEIKLKDSIFFNPWDSIGEYRSFLYQLIFDSKFRLLKLEISFNFSTNENDLKKIPVVVFDLYRKRGGHVLWQKFDFPSCELKNGKPGVWRTIKIKEYVDLSYLKGKEPYSLSLYIWNKAHCIIRFDKPVVKITGYY